MRPHIEPVLQLAPQLGIAKTCPIVLDASYLFKRRSDDSRSAFEQSYCICFGRLGRGFSGQHTSIRLCISPGSCDWCWRWFGILSRVQNVISNGPLVTQSRLIVQVRQFRERRTKEKGPHVEPRVSRLQAASIWARPGERGKTGLEGQHA